MTQTKERYWTFIVYPESVKENWKETIQQLGIQAAISPLHDKDINPDGEKKKPHYHVLLVWNGPTTYKRVASITEEIGGTIPQKVLSPVGMIRYLTHEDNPEKYQYNKQEITTINGLDPQDFVGLTKSQELQMKIAVIDLIKNLKLNYYNKLIDYLKENKMEDMFDIVSRNTMFFKEYLISARKMLTDDILSVNIKTR